MIVPIILQCFNRLEYSMQVISSIYNNLLYPHSVIVVDNGSTDGTIEYLNFCKEHGFIQHLILNGENKGIAEPKNQGLEIVKKEYPTSQFVCITDNDIVFPFVRDKDGKCALQHIVEMMEQHPEVGMCGVDLSGENAPSNQSWWWRLRQHPLTNPEFAEISIGFWGAVITFDTFKDFKFSSGTLYGRTDESVRNYLGLVMKKKVGVWKGVHNTVTHETVPSLGIHLGWREDLEKFPAYVAMKKAERFKAEKEWKETGRKW